MRTNSCVSVCVCVFPDLCATVHGVQVVPWGQDEVQEDRDLPGLCSDQERLSDMPARSVKLGQSGRLCMCVVRTCRTVDLHTNTHTLLTRMREYAHTYMHKHTHTDLEYGLPVQVRDKALAVKDDLPRSSVNKEYYLQNMDKQVTVEY